jgi:signal transduction histidine kinase
MDERLGPSQAGGGARSAADRWSRSEDPRVLLVEAEGKGQPAQEGPPSVRPLERDAEFDNITAELARTKALLRAVIASLPVGIWVAHNRVCTRVTGNTEARRQLRLPAQPPSPGEQDNLSPLCDAVQQSFRIVQDGAEVPMDRWPLVQACTEGAEVRNAEMSLHFEDGVETVLSINASPIRAHGQVIGGVGASLDITPLKHKQRALEASDARYRALCSGAAALVSTCDASLRITSPQLSWERFTGQGFSEYAGLGWLGAIHPEDRAAVVKLIDDGLNSAATGRGLFRVWRSKPEHLGRPPGGEGAGEWRRLDALLVPICGAEGRIGEWSCLWIDRTDQCRAEEALRAQAAELMRSNRDLDDFAHIVAHDLKNPIRGVRLLAGFVQEDQGEKVGVAAARMLEQINGLCSGMERMIDSILVSSEISSRPLRLERVCLSALVLDATAILVQRLRGANARVECTPLAAAATVLCDRSQVVMVLANLIGNAVKYNDSPQRLVEVGVRAGKPGSVVVTVRDNGIGIPPDKSQQVFRMFRRLHGHESYGGGAGVGLATVKRIVERHGGEVWVEQPPEGRGSVFCFTLTAG